MCAYFPTVFHQQARKQRFVCESETDSLKLQPTSRNRLIGVEKKQIRRMERQRLLDRLITT